MAEEKCALLEISIAKVKPKYVMQYVQAIPRGTELYKKHGVNFLGVYFTEAGSGPEVVFISQWANIDDRSATVGAVLKDSDFIKFMSEAGRFIYSIDAFIGFTSPLFPYKPIDGNGRICLETISMKGFPVHAEQALFEMVKQFQSVCPELPNPLAVVSPIIYSHGSLMCLYPIEDKITPLLDCYKKVMGNPENWPKLTESFSQIGMQQTRVLAPLNPEMFSEMESCKIQ